MVGQTQAPQIVLVQEHIAPVMTTLRTVSAPLPSPSFPLPKDPGKSPAHYSFLSPGAYERDDGLEHLSQIIKVKTLTLTVSSVPLVQFWSARFQLDAFQSTLHMGNMRMGTSGYSGMEGFRVRQQSYFGGPFSVHSTGLSMSFHFDREARTRHPALIWRRITGFVGAVLE